MTMAKLYFKYGVMGSSKTAQALITKFNYEEMGMSVTLYKPTIDTRSELAMSRIGLISKCIPIMPTNRIKDVSTDIIIVDECQFLTVEQVNDLRNIVDTYGINVLCYGLKTDFKSELFAGSKRLLEIADSISEIKSVCRCGQKAIISARIVNGKAVIDGEQIEIGGNEKYVPMCYKCWEEMK